LWEAIASVDSLWRKTVKVNGAQVQLNRQKPDPSGFERYRNFSEYLSNWYSTKDGDDLSTDQKEFVKFHDSKKVEIAKFMADKWSSVNQWPYDLKDRVEDLVKQIRIANGM
ncbi:MAG: hypothetical protein RLZZ519_3308, partial [Bacteroidota bacterium]